jgi:hypothetical protein
MGDRKSWPVIAGVALALVLGAWLRTHGLSQQVVQDDEWHAIHKLMASGYPDILRSFGHADHSIPLTLFYKALAGSVGLDEVNMRIVQVACGIALVGAGAWLMWRATLNGAATVLFAFLLAGAPFLILYSRFARPYAITTLLSVLVLAAIWRWRETRSPALAAAACAMAALSAWLHPLSALFPMAALGFLLVTGERRGATFALGIAAGVAILLPLALPLVSDFASLRVKAADTVPNAYTLYRMASLFAGGLPDALTIAVVPVAVFGAWQFFRAQAALGGYLLFTALAPVVAVMFLGASWTHQGHTFGRYVFPVQVIFLGWFAYGALWLVRAASRRFAPRAEAAAAVALAAGYLALNPAIAQVRTLGPWYGNLYHHYDYVYEHNRAAQYHAGAIPPRFYRSLAAAVPGTLPVIEAPFTFEAPFNLFAHYARFHRQPELQGFLHDLCVGGPWWGEVPRDARFRFRNFVYLDDPAAVARTGARYLLLHRDILHGEPFKQADACLAALQRLYGEPIEIDGRLAVFDLHRLK